VRWPLRRPFVTALGCKTHSDNVIVRARLAGGVRGWGEASSSLALPFQTGLNMAAALRRLGAAFHGADVRDLPRLAERAWRLEGRWPTAVAAFETALWDALAQSQGRPLAELWGGARRELETLLSVSAVSPKEVGRRAREASRAGHRLLKLKLNGGDGLALNRGRLRAAHRAAPRARLLLDPNQSYRPEGLRELLRQARRDGIPVELVEEPFLKRQWALLARAPVKNTPVILDESVQTPADARVVCRRGLACGVNVKLAKSGVFRTLEILEVFRSSLGRRAVFMIGCMAESRVGLAASVHLALGLGLFRYADLDSDLILKPTPERGGYHRRGPWITLPKRPRPGLGLVS